MFNIPVFNDLVMTVDNTFVRRYGHGKFKASDEKVKVVDTALLQKHRQVRPQY
jgi:hypothetical protein